jgi:hypothetical protein
MCECCMDPAEEEAENELVAVESVDKENQKLIEAD